MRGGAIDWLSDSLVDKGRWDHLATWQEHSQTIWLTLLYRAMSSLNAATGRFYWPFPRLDRDCRLLVSGQFLRLLAIHLSRCHMTIVSVHDKTQAIVFPNYRTPHFFLKIKMKLWVIQKPSRWVLSALSRHIGHWWVGDSNNPLFGAVLIALCFSTQ